MIDYSNLQGRKILLAYSGGLDTSVLLHWLQVKYNAKVVTCTARIGQKEDGNAKKAMSQKALWAYDIDLTDKFVSDYIFPCLRSGALYEGIYPLATALARPLIAETLVHYARVQECDMIAHGCTGKGNDQVRLEASIAALAKNITVIAPVRHWEFGSRSDEIDYCLENGIVTEATKERPYSVDENIWGRSIECGIIEDVSKPAPDDAWKWTCHAVNAPNIPHEIVIEFFEGNPVAVDGLRLSGKEIIEKLNSIAGAHGIGRIDMIENRLTGFKSRELYEAPAAVLLYKALGELEHLVLDKWTLHTKHILSQEYANVVYGGLWFTPARESLDAYFSESAKRLTGEVALSLYKGTITVLFRRSVYSLYDESIASYAELNKFDQRDGEGFTNIYSLPLKALAHD